MSDSEQKRIPLPVGSVRIAPQGKLELPGHALTQTFTVVTDVYCDGPDLVICTRDLQLDIAGHVTGMDGEVCG
jgi:hypothetical protein